MPTGNEWVTSGPGYKDPETVTLPRDHRSDRDRSVTVTVTRDPTVPLAAFLKLKARWQEERSNRIRAEAEREQLKATLGDVLQGLKDERK